MFSGEILILSKQKHHIPCRKKCLKKPHKFGFVNWIYMSRCIGRVVDRNTHYSSMKHKNTLLSAETIFFYTLKCSRSLSVSLSVCLSLSLSLWLCLICSEVIHILIEFKFKHTLSSYTVEGRTVYTYIMYTRIYYVYVSSLMMLGLSGFYGF